MSDLEDWQNSMNKYFPNNLHIVLQIHEWVKDPFKAQDRLMNFNITKHAKFNDMVSHSPLKLIFKKLSLVEFW